MLFIMEPIHLFLEWKDSYFLYSFETHSKSWKTKFPML